MKTVNLLPKRVIQYLNDDFDTLNLWKYDCYYHPNNLHDRPIPVKIDAPNKITNRPITVTVKSQNEEKTFTIGYGEFSGYVTNLSVDTIYEVYFEAGNQKAKKIFKTSNRLPKMMEVDGIRNVRDFGGWKADGGRLKFNKIFRGCELNLIDNHMVQVTEKGKNTMLSVMKIKTDIDLRNKEETGNITESPLGKNVSYHRCTVLGYMKIFDEEFNQVLKEIFQLFANKENYPIYLHCWAGADRTGTVVALLKAALGVNYQDITRDYEISSFSMFGLRGRCNKDFTYVEIFEHLRDKYKASSLMESTKRFLFEKVGITEKEYLNIKNNLIDYSQN